MKTRTISELHSIYKRLRERSYSLREKRKALVEESAKILTVTQKWNKDYITLYFTKGDKIYKWNLTWEEGYETWSRSSDLLKFEGSKESIRDEKINFLLNNELAFELGEKYQKLQDNGFDNFVGQILVKEICHLLSTKFQFVKLKEVPNVVPVRVNDETLTFRLLGKSNAHYKEFEYIGLLSEEIIFM